MSVTASAVSIPTNFDLTPWLRVPVSGKAENSTTVSPGTVQVPKYFPSGLPIPDHQANSKFFPSGEPIPNGQTLVEFLMAGNQMPFSFPVPSGLSVQNLVTDVTKTNIQSTTIDLPVPDIYSILSESPSATNLPIFARIVDKIPPFVRDSTGFPILFDPNDEKFAELFSTKSVVGPDKFSIPIDLSNSGTKLLPLQISQLTVFVFPNTNERVRQCMGFPNYLIFDTGKVYSLFANKFLSPKESNGYYSVTLSHNTIHKTRLVHRLVAFHFIQNFDPQKDIINHINGNKHDNHYNNLEWTTLEQNSRHAFDTGLSKAKNKTPVIKCALITGEIIEEFESVEMAAKKTGVNKCTIWRACNGASKSTTDKINGGKYLWKLKEIIEEIECPSDAVRIKDSSYFVTKDGKIWSGFAKNFLSPGISDDGYGYVSLFINNERVTRAVHRLIAETLISNPENLPQVHHIDANRLNNCIENLQWVTASNNTQQMYDTGYGIGRLKPVVMVDPQTLTPLKTFPSVTSAEAYIGIKDLSNALNGRNKLVAGYQWIYQGDEIKDLRTMIKKPQKSDLDGNVLETFDTPTEASNAVGGNRNGIAKACREEKIYQGYRWRYIEELGVVTRSKKVKIIDPDLPSS